MTEEVLKNYKDHLEYIWSKNVSSCNSIKTFNSSTLYKHITYSKLEDRLKELVKSCFIKTNGQRTEFQVVKLKSLRFFFLTLWRVNWSLLNIHFIDDSGYDPNVVTTIFSIFPNVTYIIKLIDRFVLTWKTRQNTTRATFAAGSAYLQKHLKSHSLSRARVAHF